MYLKNIINICFYGIILYITGNQVYENIYLPSMSTNVGINQLWKYKYDNIAEIVIYNGKNAYLWINKEILKIGIYDPNMFLEYLNKNIPNIKDIPVYFKTSISMSFWDIILYITLFNILNSVMSSLSKSIMGDTKVGSMVEKNIKITLNDIAGFREIKEEAMEFVDLIKNYEKYKKVGTKMPHGALFVGPPGTGKTLLAKAIAGECKLPFITASGSDFNEIFVGLGAARVKKLFRKARKHKPCIVFIDEIDALAHKRSTHTGHHDDRENTLNSLLVEMDGFSSEDGVIIFGATNRGDMLDPAILRPGRFDRKIHFSIPERNDRTEIFNYYFDKIKLSDNLNKEEETKKITDITYGFSGADISNLCNEASIIAVRKDKTSVNEDDLIEAYEYITIGTEKKNYFLTDIEKKCIAIHETGHAFLGYVLADAEMPVQISTIPRGKAALGYTLSNNPEKKLKTKNELIASIAVMCGGRIAEELFTNDITTGAMNDFEKAHTVARSIVSSYAMLRNSSTLVIDNEELYIHGDKTKSNIDDITNDLINVIYNESKKIIKSNKDKFLQLSDLLYEQEKIDKNGIEEYYPNNLLNKYKFKMRNIEDIKNKQKRIVLETETNMQF